MEDGIESQRHLAGHAAESSRANKHGRIWRLVLNWLRPQWRLQIKQTRPFPRRSHAHAKINKSKSRKKKIQTKKIEGKSIPISHSTRQPVSCLITSYWQPVPVVDVDAGNIVSVSSFLMNDSEIIYERNRFTDCFQLRFGVVLWTGDGGREWGSARAVDGGDIPVIFQPITRIN